MLKLETAKKIFENVSGSSFVGIDTVVDVKLKGGKSNPHKNRVTKRTTGSSVMVFQNKNINGYKAMVERRLGKEGKNASAFKLKPRQWGNRIPNTPFIEHEKNGEVNHYLEVIFLKAGEVQYLLDGKPVNKDDIIGLNPPKVDADSQGGLNDKVIVRSYKLNSIRKIRIDSTEYDV